MKELFKIESNKIENGDYLFSAVELNSCALKNWQSSLYYLTSAKNMFSHCDNLENFYGDLSSLSNGSGMFNNCSKLSQFSVGGGSLSNLENGTKMFCDCTSLSTFNYDMGYLNVANDMFRGCKSLKTFYGYLSNLSDGSYMFYECSSLNSFGYGLYSLEDGESMFRGCNLNSESVQNILDSVPRGKGNYLELTMDANGCQKAVELLGLSSGTIPYHEGNNGLMVDYDNWRFILTTSNASGFTIGSGNSGDTVVLGTKYLGCKNGGDVVAIDPNYLTNDIIDGVWTQSLAGLEYGFISDCNDGLFNGSNTLTVFKSDLSSLTGGYSMFNGATNLTTFDADLSSLTGGYSMFTDCRNLTTFTSDLSSLEDGFGMFYNCSALNYFTSNLSSLSEAWGMFYGCSKLTTFASDLSSLTNGYDMFYNCSALTTFTSDLSSLTNGRGMFYGCKLNTASVQNIANAIKNVSGLQTDYIDVYTTINIDIANRYPNTEEVEAFNAIGDKGWEVYANGAAYYGSTTCCATCCASLATLDENGEETTETPIPFYAKPVPAPKDKAEYVDSEGNYYNVLGAQFIYVSDPETYGMFTSLEDAVANMRLTKIGEEEIETA